MAEARSIHSFFLTAPNQHRPFCDLAGRTAQPCPSPALCALFPHPLQNRMPWGERAPVALRREPVSAAASVGAGRSPPGSSTRAGRRDQVLLPLPNGQRKRPHGHSNTTASSSQSPRHKTGLAGCMRRSSWPLTSSAGFAISINLPFPSYREEYPMPVGSVLYSFRSRYKPQAFFLLIMLSNGTVAMLPYRCFPMRRLLRDSHCKQTGAKVYPILAGNYRSNTGSRYREPLSFCGVYC